MTKTVKSILAGLLIVPALALGISLVAPVIDHASALSLSEGVTSAKGAGTADNLFGAGSVFTTVINILLYIIGAISVVMLIIGGIKYTVSNGDAAQVTSAKNTILYAIVGIVIAFLAFAAVNWVLTSLTNGATGA